MFVPKTSFKTFTAHKVLQHLKLSPWWRVFVVETVGRVCPCESCLAAMVDRTVRWGHLRTVTVRYAGHCRRIGHLIGCHHRKLHGWEVIHVAIVAGVSVVWSWVRWSLVVGVTHRVGWSLHAAACVHNVVDGRDGGWTPDGRWTVDVTIWRTSYNRGLVNATTRGGRRWRWSFGLFGGLVLRLTLTFALSFLGFLLLSTLCSSVFKPYLQWRNKMIYKGNHRYFTLRDQAVSYFDNLRNMVSFDHVTVTLFHNPWYKGYPWLIYIGKLCIFGASNHHHLLSNELRTYKIDYLWVCMNVFASYTRDGQCVFESFYCSAQRK